MKSLKSKKLIAPALAFMMFTALARLSLPAAEGQMGSAAGRPGNVFYSGSGKRQLFMFNFSLGTAAYLKGRSGLHQPLGMGLSLSYVRNRQFYGVRAVSATFTDWGGRDSSLLYGRAWVSDRSMFSIASGLGISTFSGSFHRIGLPLDIKAITLSRKNSGISFGLHGFAFFTTSYLHFGICLNLGIFVFSG